MSSTNRGSVRRPADDYPTPEWCTRALLKCAPPPSEVIVCDPCAGEGAILRVMSDAGYTVRGIEIRPECRAMLCLTCDSARIDDALAAGGPVFPGESVVTNPPFSALHAFIERWTPGRPYAAFLLPLNAFRGQGRAAWWQGREPKAILALPRRPSFVSICKIDGKKGCGRSFPVAQRGPCPCGEGMISTGTDSIEYGWFLWGALVEPGIRVARLDACT
mgnify:CR=1 FL=1